MRNEHKMNMSLDEIIKQENEMSEKDLDVIEVNNESLMLESGDDTQSSERIVISREENNEPRNYRSRSLGPVNTNFHGPRNNRHRSRSRSRAPGPPFRRATTPGPYGEGYRFRNQNYGPNHYNNNRWRGTRRMWDQRESDQREVDQNVIELTQNAIQRMNELYNNVPRSFQRAPSVGSRRSNHSYRSNRSNYSHHSYRSNYSGRSRYSFRSNKSNRSYRSNRSNYSHRSNRSRGFRGNHYYRGRPYYRNNFYHNRPYFNNNPPYGRRIYNGNNFRNNNGHYYGRQNGYPYNDSIQATIRQIQEASRRQGNGVSPLNRAPPQEPQMVHVQSTTIPLNRRFEYRPY